MLFQLFLGERADAARQLKQGWLRHFEPSSAEPPEIAIPPGLNGKTVSREVCLPACFAHAVHSWMQKPLRGGKGHHWPFVGQKLEEDTDVLFPGLGAKQQRINKPVSERAYLDAINKASKVLVKAREQARNNGATHVYEGVNLLNLGTHTIKKTHVTLLKANGFSTALVSSITGTSPATLERHYDVPTGKRQREALQDVFGPIVESKKAEPSSNEPEQLYCGNCGKRVASKWHFCRYCGQETN